MRIWLFAIALAACGGKKDDAPAPAPAKPDDKPSTDVQVFVNEQPVAKLDAAKVATWARLDAQVPSDVRKIGTWQSLKFVGGKNDEIKKPSDNYRDMVPAVFPGEGGLPAFGMFDPVELAKHGQPAVREDRLREIHIEVAQNDGRGGNEDNASADSDPTKLAIELHGVKDLDKLTGDKLLAIPRDGEPGGSKKGWKLATILAALKVDKFDKILLSDAGGTTLPVAKADMSDDYVPFIRLNKQGQLRVRVYKKQGEGWTNAGDLRALASIDVK